MAADPPPEIPMDLEPIKAFVTHGKQTFAVNVVESLIAEVERLRAAGDARPQPTWQPIETAPMNDCWFLGYGEAGRHVCCRRDGVLCVLVGDYETRGIALVAELYRLTHWMPLPAPPVSGVAGEDPARSAEAPS